MTLLLGEQNGQAKLTQDQVLQIYELAWSGRYTQTEIRQMFNVSRDAVRAIKTHANWKWLTKGESEMSVEVKLTGKSMEQRIADRLKPSGDPRAEHHTQQGSGPTRVHHFIHNAGHVVQPGTAARETGPQEQRHHDAATTQDVNPYGGDDR